jgi:hypothetical protein
MLQYRREAWIKISPPSGVGCLERYRTQGLKRGIAMICRAVSVGGWMEKYCGWHADGKNLK